ncbi:O-antigen ligase family protein [Tepidimonas ignava]|nr:O-antigen ligase family protein [Tepidimonas ignava]
MTTRDITVKTMPGDAYLNPPASTWLKALAFLSGFAAFLPIGLVYLTWIAFAIATIIIPGDPQKYKPLRHKIIILIFLPALLATASIFIHGPHEQTATRIFHAYRSGLVIAIGLIVFQMQREWVLKGLFTGSSLALIIIIIHRVIIDLPLASPFYHLLHSDGNASSQKMIMLATVSGMAFWLMFIAKGRKIQLLYLVFWLVSACTVALHSISRNAYLILLALPLAALIYRYRHPKGISIAVALSMALGLAVWVGSDTVRSRSHDAINEIQSFLENGNYIGSTSARARMMLEATTQMLNNPLTGTGTGSWLEHWREKARDAPEVAGLNNPHNDYLLAGMENGIPGLLALVGLLGAFLYVNWKNNDHWGGLGFVVTISVIITAAVNAPFRDAVMGMALTWIMAVCTRLPSSSGYDVHSRPCRE